MNKIEFDPKTKEINDYILNDLFQFEISINTGQILRTFSGIRDTQDDIKGSESRRRISSIVLKTALLDIFNLNLNTDLPINDSENIFEKKEVGLMA